MEDDHLIDSFYITKPTFIHQQLKELIFSKEDSRQTCCQIPLKEADNPTSKQVLKINHKYHSSDKQIEKSYRMISKKIYCSASVSIPRKLKSSFSSQNINQLEQQQKGMNFIEKLQNMLKYQTYILQKPKIQIKSKSSSSIHQFKEPNFYLQRQDQLNFEGKEVSEEKKKGKNYYQRVRHNIQHNIQHLLPNNQKQKTKNVITKNSSKKAAEKIKKQKGYLKSKSSRLKLSRSGLLITSSGEQKSLVASYGKLQDHKAKKDMIFKKCLQKNCQIVLQNVLKYQKEIESREYLSKFQYKTDKPTIQKRFTPSSRPISSDFRNHKCSVDNKEILSSLRWKQKCLNIQIACKQNYKSTPNLKKGINVFGKYCNRVNKNLQCTSSQIKNVLFEISEQDNSQCNYKNLIDILPNSINGTNDQNNQ